MYIQKTPVTGGGCYYRLLRSEWREGKSCRVLVATLGKTEKQTIATLKKIKETGRTESGKEVQLSDGEYEVLKLKLDTDIWGTPQWVVSLVREGMGRIDLDPATTPSNPVGAPKFYTEKDDGLLLPWFGSVYCNPPYSKPEPWIRRMVETYQAGVIEQGFLLSKAGTHQNKGTGPLVKTADFRGLWHGRLKFESLRPGRKSKTPDFDVAIAYWGANAQRVEELFKPYVV